MYYEINRSIITFILLKNIKLNKLIYKKYIYLFKILKNINIHILIQFYNFFILFYFLIRNNKLNYLNINSV